MNFKTIAEVYSHLDGKGLGRIRSFLDNAIAQETKDLCSINSDTPENNRKDAEKHFLEEINFFLGEGSSRDLDPNIIINYRRRPKSWAVAAMIEDSNAEHKDEDK